MPGLDDVAKAAQAAVDVTTVTYGGFTVRVKPPMQWRQSAMEAVTVGQFNKWARGALVNDRAVGPRGKITGSDDPQVFVDADLTNAEVLEFFAEYAAVAGQPPGE